MIVFPVLPKLRTRLAQNSKSNGAPTLIFVTGAALRVADVTRVLKSKKIRGEKGGEVAKLFARHFPLEEHVTYLKRTKVGAAVGTPGRIGKLLCDTGKLTVTLAGYFYDGSSLNFNAHGSMSRCVEPVSSYAHYIRRDPSRREKTDTF